MPEDAPGAASSPTEARLPCPVCLGIKMSKVRIASQDLVLDRCRRCGGIWFDEGEVEQLRQLKRQKADRRIRLSDDAFHMRCHSCQTIMDRNAERCEACNWRNRVDCPVCAETMDRREIHGLHLDFCTPCRGVWFDRIELAEIWNLQVGALAPATAALAGLEGATLGKNLVETAGDAAAAVGDVAADVLIWNPELLIWGGKALGHGARAATELLGNAPEVLSAVADAGGDLAGSVFEAIAEIIGAILS